MMAAWVSCAETPPPTGETLSVRSGANLFWAALTKYCGWKLIGPGGTEEAIEEPAEWWSEDAVATDTESSPQAPPQGTRLRRRRGAVQCELNLASHDSGTQSRHRGEAQSKEAA